MKIAIVIPFFIGASSITSAQTTTPGTVPLVIKPLTLELPAAGIRPVLPPRATLLAGKAVALPQDNMPCLVPQRATAAVIPNAAKFVLPGNPMPNASRVHPVIPKR